MVDLERLKHRVAGREQAEIVAGLVILTHPDMIAAFFDELKTRLQPEQVQQKRQAKERKLSELKSHTMEFGMHAGECLDDIPREYLGWMVQQSEETLQIIGEYLKLTAESDEFDEE